MDTNNWLYLAIMGYTIVAICLVSFAVVRKGARLFDMKCVEFVEDLVYGGGDKK